MATHHEVPYKLEGSARDQELVVAIVNRAIRMGLVKNADHAGFLKMDIMNVHLNGCPLLLEGLLASSDATFEHDVEGIHVHVDRQLGGLRALTTWRPHYMLLDRPLVR